jgi:hypothetical protein
MMRIGPSFRTPHPKARKDTFSSSYFILGAFGRWVSFVLRPSERSEGNSKRPLPPTEVAETYSELQEVNYPLKTL